MVTRLLMAKGLSVGTYTSPHLERINERIALERRAHRRRGLRRGDRRRRPASSRLLAIAPSYFEILTAAALPLVRRRRRRRRRSSRSGCCGRWDATNVVDGQVAVVTNVGLDHTDVRRRLAAAIAAEKAGIVKPGATLVLRRDRRRTCVPIFAAKPGRGAGARGVDFGVRRQPARPSAAGCSTCARRRRATTSCSSRCTARTRATTRPSRSPRPRRSSARPLDADLVEPRRSPRSRRRAGSRWSGRQPLVHPRRRPQPGGRGARARRDRSRTTSASSGDGCWWSACSAAAIPTDARRARTRPTRSRGRGVHRRRRPRAMPAEEVAAAAARDSAATRGVEVVPRRRPRRCDRALAGAGRTTPCSSPARSTSSARPGPHLGALS